MKKKLLSTFLLIFLLVAFTIPAGAQATEKVMLNKARAILEIDAKITLKLGNIEADKVEWNSSAKKIATVSNKGVVTAKSEGNAKITAIYEKKKYICEITVVDSDKENSEEAIVSHENDAIKLYLKEIREKGTKFWIENLKASSDIAEKGTVGENENIQIPEIKTPDKNSGSDAGSGKNNPFNTYDNEEQQKTTDSYVLNTKSKKIHWPSCYTVKKIAPKNYSTSNLSIKELEKKGYSKCGICFK